MSRLRTEVLIVGGGAAGLSAAMAASEKSEVTIVDDNPILGGQIWRAELGKTGSREATRLIAAIESQKIRVLNNAQVFSSLNANSLLSETPDGQLEIQYENLVIATGARELFLPFPGWTSPFVTGVGGLQALVKGGLSIKGKRVVVAGTGPLLLAVASYLRSRGASIAAIAEQTSRAKINRFALGLLRSPWKVVQAISLRSKLIGTKYLTDCWVTSMEATGSYRTARFFRNGKQFEIKCDLLACGFHLVPNIELAILLQCEIVNGCVIVDEFQRTSRENIYCAGEPVGIGGIETSLVEGRIAGLAATGEFEKSRKHFAVREKARKFGGLLNRTFELRDELRSLAEQNTIVCRCEDVDFGHLRSFDSWRSAKLQTRCGMGPCQGRICGAATQFLFGWESPNVRPPIFPVKMENL